MVGPLKGHRNRVISMPGFVADTLGLLCGGKGRDKLLWTDKKGEPRNP